MEHIDDHILRSKISKKNCLIEPNSLSGETNQKSEPRENFVSISKNFLDTWNVVIMPQYGLDENGPTL